MWYFTHCDSLHDIILLLACEKFYITAYGTVELIWYSATACQCTFSSQTLPVFNISCSQLKNKIWHPKYSKTCHFKLHFFRNFLGRGKLSPLQTPPSVPRGHPSSREHLCTNSFGTSDISILVTLVLNLGTLCPQIAQPWRAHMHRPITPNTQPGWQTAFSLSYHYIVQRQAIRISLNTVTIGPSCKLVTG